MRPVIFTIFFFLCSPLPCLFAFGPNRFPVPDVTITKISTGVNETIISFPQRGVLPVMSSNSARSTLMKHDLCFPLLWSTCSWVNKTIEIFSHIFLCTEPLLYDFCNCLLIYNISLKLKCHNDLIKAKYSNIKNLFLILRLSLKYTRPVNGISSLEIR